MNIALIVLLALAASIAGNVWQHHELGVEHDKLTTAESKLTEANNATKTCNDSIDGLKREAEARGAANERARQAAADRRRKGDQRADQILGTPATTPGDDCKSARDRVANWLKARKP